MQVVGDLHRRAARTEEDDRPRVMPAAERASRLAEVRYLLPGLEIEGDLVPSNALVDKYSNMMGVTGVLRYIPLVEITCQDQELKGVKKDLWWKPDQSGAIRQHAIDQELEADISTDYKFHRALMRRGVALQMARIMNYQTHDILVRRLMKEYMRAPIPGYRKISLDQVLLADQEIFSRLAEESLGGLNILPVDGTLVLDGILPQIINEPRILAFLNPLPSLAARSSGDDHGGQSKRSAEKEIERLKGELKKAKTGGGRGDQRGGGKGVGGKGKKRDKKPFIKMPKDLIGLSPLINGVGGCFDYNLRKGCELSIDGNGACKWGKHACLRCGSTGHGASSSRCEKNR